MNCIKVYKLYLPIFGGIFSLSFNCKNKYINENTNSNHEINIPMSSYEDFTVINPEYNFYKAQSIKFEKPEPMRNDRYFQNDFPKFDIEERKTVHEKGPPELYDV